MTRHESPGKAHREGITVVQLMDMFPDETAAREWFEHLFWNGERCCGHCGRPQNHDGFSNEMPMPYWCSDCRWLLLRSDGDACSNAPGVPLRKWAIAIYLEAHELEDPCQVYEAAPRYRHFPDRRRLGSCCTVFVKRGRVPMGKIHSPDPVEIDEVLLRWQRARNKHAHKRKQVMNAGRGPVW